MFPHDGASSKIASLTCKPPNPVSSAIPLVFQASNSNVNGSAILGFLQAVSDTALFTYDHSSSLSLNVNIKNATREEYADDDIRNDLLSDLYLQTKQIAGYKQMYYLKGVIKSNSFSIKVTQADTSGFAFNTGTLVNSRATLSITSGDQKAFTLDVQTSEPIPVFLYPVPYDAERLQSLEGHTSSRRSHTFSEVERDASDGSTLFVLSPPWADCKVNGKPQFEATITFDITAATPGLRNSGYKYQLKLYGNDKLIDSTEWTAPPVKDINLRPTMIENDWAINKSLKCILERDMQFKVEVDQITSWTSYKEGGGPDRIKIKRFEAKISGNY